MSRCIVNVSSDRYVGGLRRLASSAFLDCAMLAWSNQHPPGSPPHHRIPYGFKAWALKAAADAGHQTILWADASIVPVAPLLPLWEKIERDGYWISRNGWTNYEWTCDTAYSDLGVSRDENRQIPHVVATTFGVSLAHDIGRRIFDEYLRLARTVAFCGPWWNRNHPEYARQPQTYLGRRWCEPCGPADVRGHRHDQTALSVIAARAGAELTSAPRFFAYRGGETTETVLVADSNY